MRHTHTPNSKNPFCVDLGNGVAGMKAGKEEVKGGGVGWVGCVGCVGVDCKVLVSSIGNETDRNRKYQ